MSTWVKEAGFKHSTCKKSCHVDEHKDKEVVRDRNALIENYFEAQVEELCWIQLLKSECLQLNHRYQMKEKTESQHPIEKEKKNDLLEKTEKKMKKHLESFTLFYSCPKTGVEMVESHVDVICGHDNKTDKNLPSCTPNLPELGGWKSVRLEKDEKPVMVLGQDEAMHRGSQPNGHAWTMDDESPFGSKGLGSGVVVSAFVSSAFGFVHLE